MLYIKHHVTLHNVKLEKKHWSEDVMATYIPTLVVDKENASSTGREVNDKPWFLTQNVSIGRKWCHRQGRGASSARHRQGPLHPSHRSPPPSHPYPTQLDPSFHRPLHPFCHHLSHPGEHVLGGGGPAPLTDENGIGQGGRGLGCKVRFIDRGVVI